jgi:hypothetical protein
VHHINWYNVLVSWNNFSLAAASPLEVGPVEIILTGAVENSAAQKGI